MSIAKHMKNLMDIDLDAPQKTSNQPSTSAANKSSGRPTTAPSQLAAFSTEFTKISEEAEQLRQSMGQPIEADLAKIIVSPYQTRRVNRDRVEELVANLAVNPLSSPITVRRRPDGLLELVAGHHRVEAFRILQRPMIPAVIVEMTDDEAERLVFYDNLLAPSLSDFERYLGFDARKKRHRLSDQALADEAGVSRSLVQALMSFGRLPEAVLRILDEHRELMGSSLATKLAGLDKKFADRMVEATQLLLEGKLTQVRVVPWIEQAHQTREQKESQTPEPLVLRRGRQTYAKVTRSDKKLVISWTDADEAKELEAAITAVLNQRLEMLRRADLPESGNAPKQD